VLGKEKQSVVDMSVVEVLLVALVEKEVEKEPELVLVDLVQILYSEFRLIPPNCNCLDSNLKGKASNTFRLNQRDDGEV